MIDRYFLKKPRLRAAVTRMLYGTDDRRISLIGTDLTINSALENGYLRAYSRAQRLNLFRVETPVLINLAGLMTDDTTFVDVGANIGIYSATMARLARVRKNIRVLALEVDPLTFKRLEINAKANGFEARRLGISDKEKLNVEFTRGGVSNVTMMSEHQNEWSMAGNTFHADCVPLASLDIPGSSIILKIDVEGHELEVLKGATPLFEQGRVAGVYLDGFGRPDEVLAFLKAQGFSFFEGDTLRPTEGHVFSLLAIKNGLSY